jgi:hypothetical protein
LKVRVPGGLAFSQASCAIDQINPRESAARAGYEASVPLLGVPPGVCANF